MMYFLLCNHQNEKTEGQAVTKIMKNASSTNQSFQHLTKFAVVTTISRERGPLWRLLLVNCRCETITAEDRACTEGTNTSRASAPTGKVQFAVLAQPDFPAAYQINLFCDNLIPGKITNTLTAH